MKEIQQGNLLGERWKTEEEWPSVGGKAWLAWPLSRLVHRRRGEDYCHGKCTLTNRPPGFIFARTIQFWPWDQEIWPKLKALRMFRHRFDCQLFFSFRRQMSAFCPKFFTIFFRLCLTKSNWTQAEQLNCGFKSACKNQIVVGILGFRGFKSPCNAKWAAANQHETRQGKERGNKAMQHKARQ